MKVRHLLNLKIACITFLLACIANSAFSQETKVYLGRISREGKLGKAITSDSIKVRSDLEGYYWFTLHEDTAIRYSGEDCTFRQNPLQRAIDNQEALGFSVEGGKGHTVLRYLHYDRDSVSRAMSMLLKFSASSGPMASNIFWGLQELECTQQESIHYKWKSNYFHLDASRFLHDIDHHSQSRLIINDNANHVIVSFKGVQSQDLPTLMVLEYLLKQKEHSFQQNMVQSGICLEAEFSFNANNLNDFIGFSLRPNPFAVSESVEELFNELDKMPLFNYTSKKQLDLAKMQIAIDLEFMEDRTFSKEAWNTSLWACANEGLFDGFMDSVQQVTKVDLMNLINTYIYKRPFFLVVEAPENKVEELNGVIMNTKEIDQYRVSFEGVKDSRLDDEASAQLESVAYLLNLTSWAPVEVHLYSGKKRSSQKREKALIEYLKAAGVTNEVSFHYHRNLQGTSECATFSIVANGK